ncbi:MAG: DNA repair protein RadC [Bacteroidales bacterium]|nr:DNA repair protein RadC [Bacteroidales bacterium]
MNKPTAMEDSGKPMRAIKNMPQQDRPREKALEKGVAMLTDAELLATLIGSGQPGESVVDLCRRILHDSDDKLYKLARLRISDLMRYNGIGEVKAINIMAALELGRRLENEEFVEQPTITNSDVAKKLLRRLMAHLDHERLMLLVLDRAKHVVKECVVSDGGLSATVGDVKMIMRLAIENCADSIILAHNHPSNNPSPSRQDDMLTQKVAEAGKLLDIMLVDHIIVTQGRCYSYLDNGRL